MLVGWIFFCTFVANMQQMITILGPTASGKTPLAAALAKQVDGEIISADSRQVYRRMDIGTGKDLADYDGVPYHLIDICEPGTKYNLFQYQQDFFDAYEDIRSRGVLPILCGGTGLYIEAVLKGYHLSPVPQNPELRQQLEGRSLDELTQMLEGTEGEDWLEHAQHYRRRLVPACHTRHRNRKLQPGAPRAAKRAAGCRLADCRGEH